MRHTTSHFHTLSLTIATTAALFLSACATQLPAETTPPPQADRVAPATAEPSRPASSGAVSDLSPEDPGIIALAKALADTQLVSFSSTQFGSQEDAALKSALTQALIERNGIGLVLLDAPCQGAADLDTYVRGAVTPAYAADVVRLANISPGLKTAALADLLVMLRGWNAIYPEAPVRIGGHTCHALIEEAGDRPAVFWGLSAPPADFNEKSFAATLLESVTTENQGWLVQSGPDGAGPDHPVPGWQRLPSTVEGEETGPDILFRHSSYSPADPA